MQVEVLIKKIQEVVVVVIRQSILFLLLACSSFLLAQKSFMTFDTTVTEIDFLSSYYTQDGENSPVTGGLGTEELTTVDNRIIVSFAPDTLHKVTANHGVNVISSASTDKIDGISSASKDDAHVSISIAYSKILPLKQLISSWNGSFSAESDYSSKGIGYSLQRVSKNNNHRIGISANAYFDDWVMIFPEELREDKSNFPSKDYRNSYSLVLHGNSVLNKRTIFHWDLGGTMQNGLLSTPFHRVYFSDTSASGLEILPDQRIKAPIAMGVNMFLFHFLVLKPHYRFYADNFGIRSNTFSINSVVKINPYLSLKGSFRYSIQNGSKYFNEYAQASILDQYRTSDYDLSSFTSNYYNLGLCYAPLKSILTFKRLSIKMIEFRFASFQRSNGLRSNLYSFYIKFSQLKG